MSVVEKITGYKKMKFHTHENAGYGDVRLPDMQMHTTSFWITVPESLFFRYRSRQRHRRAARHRTRARDGGHHRAHVRAARHRSSARRQEPRHQQGRSLGEHFDPTLFLFDHIPGGVGLAERIFEMASGLLERTCTMISGCPCEAGCPGVRGSLRARREPTEGRRPRSGVNLRRYGCWGA